jgi:hypothetical protein
MAQPVSVLDAEGRPTGPGFSASFAVCGAIQSSSERYAALAGSALVGEYNIDEQGNYTWTLWEWKAAQG